MKNPRPISERPFASPDHAFIKDIMNQCNTHASDGIEFCLLVVSSSPDKKLEDVEDNVDEEGVDEANNTETFVALKLFINNWRWSGVPFFLRTGKRMKKKVSEIVVRYKNIPHNIFSSDTKVHSNQVTITLANYAEAFDTNLNAIQQFTVNAEFDFSLSSAMMIDNDMFLATQNYGILQSNVVDPSNYLEIHPEGPLSNDIFSIAANNEDVWVVYGGYDKTYTPLGLQRGFSHYNGTNWINTRFDPATPYSDLNHITIDTNAENKVFISSAGDTGNVNSVATGGLLVVENDVVTQFYNHFVPKTLSTGSGSH